MRKILMMIALASPLAYAAPPAVDNTLPPCDSAGTNNSTRPPCSADSESIRIPPKTPNESERIIVPPEEPVNNLPDRSQNPNDIVDEPRPGDRTVR